MGKINSNYNYSYTIIRDTLDSVKAALETVDSALSTIDDAITSINTALDGKQDTLVSGTNIKTINSGSILGEGNIVLQEPIVAGTGISIAADGKTISATASANLYRHRISFKYTRSTEGTFKDIPIYISFELLSQTRDTPFASISQLKAYMKAYYNSYGNTDFQDGITAFAFPNFNTDTSGATIIGAVVYTGAGLINSIFCSIYFMDSQSQLKYLSAINIEGADISSFHDSCWSL